MIRKFWLCDRFGVDDTQFTQARFRRTVAGKPMCFLWAWTSSSHNAPPVSVGASPPCRRRSHGRTFDPVASEVAELNVGGHVSSPTDQGHHVIDRGRTTIGVSKRGGD